MSRTYTVSAGLAAATLALFALTGCGSAESGTTTEPAAESSGAAEEQSSEAEAPAADQSVEEACSLLNTELSAVSTQINDAQGELTEAMQSGDTAAATELFSEIGTKIDDIGAQITNADVSAAFDTYATTWGDFEALFTEVSEASAAQDQEALTEAASGLTDASSSFLDATSELTEVCNG